MALPGSQITTEDGGLATVAAAGAVIAVVGACSAGTANTVLDTTSATLISSTFGSGPMPDLAALLASYGIEVLATKVTSTVAAAAGSVTWTRAGTDDGTVAIGGVPLDAWEIIVEIMGSTASVATGDGSFRVSLDGGDSYGPIIALVTGAISIPGSGITLTFTNGVASPTFKVGSKAKATCTAPGYSSTDLGTAVDAILAYPTRPRLIVVVGEAATSAAAATIATLLDGKLVAASAAYKDTRALLGVPLADSDATIKAAFASFASTLGCVWVAPGACNFASGLKSGRFHKRSAVWPIALRIGQELIHRDPGRVKSGSLQGIAPLPDGSSGIYRDEAITPGLDVARFLTLRTYTGKAGYFVTRGVTMADPSSDFADTNLGLIIDRAREVLNPAMAEEVNDSPRTISGGRIDPRDANTIEGGLQMRIEAALLAPGHVSGIRVLVDRTVNLLTTQTLVVKYRILPRGKTRWVTGSISYALSLEAA